MKRIIWWGASTMTALVLLFGYHTSTSGPSLNAATSIDSGAAGSGSGAGSAGSQGGASGSRGSGTTGDSDPGGGLPDSSDGSESQDSGTSDGGEETVSGDAVDTRWGSVQVAVTVSDGRITDVSVPVYPQGNGRDLQINAYALPILVDETLTAQSADVDMVSGATVTSLGYQQSLQSAIDRAGI